MELLDQILAYQPKSPSETAAKDFCLQALHNHPDSLFTRENAQFHFTASAMILNPEQTKTLMVYHNIYQSISWTGGHADGQRDLLQVALREAKEETGIEQLFPLSDQILSLDLLPVPQHKKNGQVVPAHHHLSVAYGAIAPEDQILTCRPAENSLVTWVPCERLPEICTESHMLPLYQKLIRRMAELAAEKENKLNAVTAPLLAWYAKHARHLPWRDNPSPYHVWVSEIMLQQTRVETVKPYYQRFLKALPNVEALANASETQLLKLWEGLGYYSRVRNMQKTAKRIVSQYDGRFPSDPKELRTLPGIGEYTAGAIASIAFDLPEPAVDGNVMRVFTRLTENFRDISRPATKRYITELLRPLYPPQNRGAFTQSLMELGATVCLPNSAPLCEHCPLASLCVSYAHGTNCTLPRKATKKSREKQEKTVLLLVCDSKIIIRRRKKKGLLAGMWQFPDLEGYRAPEEIHRWMADYGLIPLRIQTGPKYKHIFTHKEWWMISYLVECERPFPLPNCQWVTRQELQNTYPLPAAYQPFLKQIPSSLF